MSIFDKFRSIAALRDDFLQLGSNPFNVVIEQVLSATEASGTGWPSGVGTATALSRSTSLRRSRG